MEISRKRKVFDFVVKHKTDCYRAFKLSADHEGFKTTDGSKLIELARKEIGYSEKTWSGDIYYALWRIYKAITIDGVSEPEEVINEEYKLIPMSEITDEARKLAVAWMECEDKNWIKQKHKLASDIMNYAKKYHAQFSNVTDEDIEKWAEDVDLLLLNTKVDLFMSELRRGIAIGIKAYRDGLIKSSPVEGEKDKECRHLKTQDSVCGWSVDHLCNTPDCPAYEPQKVYYCTVCKKNPVDAENGYDTCHTCMSNI